MVTDTFTTNEVDTKIVAGCKEDGIWLQSTRNLLTRSLLKHQQCRLPCKLADRLQ
jgi:hypothetical protein